MKTNELQLGNRLLLEGEECIVMGIQDQNVSTIASKALRKGYGELQVGTIDDYDPIQLTYKVLEEFNFTANDDGDFTHPDNPFIILQDFDAVDEVGFVLRINGGYYEIKYLHELQNIFSTITGKQLTK